MKDIMTSSERFRAALTGSDMDRIPLYELGFWPQTLDRWRNEGLPNDPRFSDLWGLFNTGQTGGTPGADIEAPNAWSITTGNSNVIVAVLDSGVDYSHQDVSTAAHSLQALALIWAQLLVLVQEESSHAYDRV